MGTKGDKLSEMGMGTKETNYRRCEWEQRETNYRRLKQEQRETNCGNGDKGRQTIGDVNANNEDKL